MKQCKSKSLVLIVLSGMLASSAAMAAERSLNEIAQDLELAGFPMRGQLPPENAGYGGYYIMNLGQTGFVCNGMSEYLHVSAEGKTIQKLDDRGRLTALGVERAKADREYRHLLHTRTVVTDRAVADPMLEIPAGEVLDKYRFDFDYSFDGDQLTVSESVLDLLDHVAKAASVALCHYTRITPAQFQREIER